MGILNIAKYAIEKEPSYGGTVIKIKYYLENTALPNSSSTICFRISVVGVPSAPPILRHQEKPT